MKKSDQYYKTYRWMGDELGLRDDEIKIYAIIYGFQKKENKNFNGSAAFLADWIHITPRGVQKILKSLKEKGLLRVIKKSATRNEYRVIVPKQIDNDDEDDNEKNTGNLRTEFANVYELSSQTKKKVQSGVYEHSSQPLRTEFANVYELSSHNINNNNINTYIDCQTKYKSDIPTREEVHEYVAAHDLKINPDAYYDENESRHWITMAGTPVRCWKNHLRFWARPDIPTREEVRKYVAKHKLKIDPDKYYDENESRHWITIAGTPVRRWENHLKFWASTERPEKDYQNAMMHTQYDYDEIEQKLLRN